MKIPLDISRSAQENAAIYYDRAKKMREKTEGTEKAVEETRKELGKFEAVAEKKPKMKRKAQWYEKFHWFISSDGFLVIGGGMPSRTSCSTRNTLRMRMFFSMLMCMALLLWL